MIDKIVDPNSHLSLFSHIGYQFSYYPVLTHHYHHIDLSYDCLTDPRYREDKKVGSKLS